LESGNLIKVEGLNVNVRISGIGERVILFLHGWGGSITSFELAENFFKKSYRTINLDFLGHGKSDNPPCSGFGVSEYAEYIKLLLDTLRIHKLDIVAHSFGGRVAIMLAYKYPELVNKLVLTASAGIKPRFSLARSFKIAMFKLKRKLNKKGLLKRFDESDHGSSDFKRLSENMKRVFINVVNEDLASKLKHIEAPTLIIWGKRDRDTPMYMARKLVKGLKNSKLVIFEEAGHYAYLERFDRFLSLVTEFLSE